MALLLFSVPCIVLLSMIFGCDCNYQDQLVVSFYRTVRANLKDSDFHRLFSVNFKDNNDFERAGYASTQEFSRAYGIPVPEYLKQKFIENALKATIRVSSETFLSIYANTVARTLILNNILNVTNVERLGRLYALFLSTSTSPRQSSDFETELESSNRATAYFLISQYPPSEQHLLQYQYILLDEEQKALKLN